jgi:hypothetical protein
LQGAGALYTNGSGFGNWNTDVPLTETGATTIDINNVFWAEGNDTAPLALPPINGVPSGGETYDIEFLAWRAIGNEVQVLGITSVNPFTGNAFQGQVYQIGDVFIDVDGGGSDYALTTAQAYTTTYRDHLTNAPFTHDGVVGLYDLNDVVAHGIAIEHAYGNNPLVAGLADFNAVSGAANAQGLPASLAVTQIQNDGGAPNWALEWTINRAVFESLLDLSSDHPYANVTMHWTVGCGNDWLDTEAPGDREPTIPEPATLALLGLGLATMGVVRRRRA